MTYSTQLFTEPNDFYEAYMYGSREEWLAGRGELEGIGGSDSPSALGISKWKSNLRLWYEKTGRQKAPDISNHPAVRYGTLAEEHIRAMYVLDHPEYEVNYAENVILKSKKHPCMLYSPDGLIRDRRTGRIGVLEIKTAQIRGNAGDWKDRIPMPYYVQVIHGLQVTGADFVNLRAWLKYSDEYEAVKTYRIEREDVLEDIEYVTEKVERFWQYVKKDIEPPQIIGGFE